MALAFFRISKIYVLKSKIEIFYFLDPKGVSTVVGVLKTKRRKLFFTFMVLAIFIPELLFSHFYGLLFLSFQVGIHTNTVQLTKLFCLLTKYGKVSKQRNYKNCFFLLGCQTHMFIIRLS